MIAASFTCKAHLLSGHDQVGDVLLLNQGGEVHRVVITETEFTGDLIRATVEPTDKGAAHTICITDSVAEFEIDGEVAR